MKTRYANGFALPTVMIASVVMLMVLLSGLVAASSSNTALREQYQLLLAKQAAQAGASMVEACLKNGNYIGASWTNPLRPNTDCSGNPLVACSTALDTRCGVVETANTRSTFSIAPFTVDAGKRMITVVGSVTSYRNGSGSRTESGTQTYQLRQSVSFKNFPPSSRAAKRFWLFGRNAGLDFGTSGSTVATTNKCATGQVCEGNEGTTVIARKDGTLQFWTDGRTIWNRNGQVMNDSAGVPTSNPPGSGGLNANPSTTQAAAVLPIGSDETRYVIVTNNTENGVNNLGELFYSVVDMSLNGGLGAVQAANKNLQLISGALDYASEGLTAAPKADGSGYWVVTYTPNTTRIVAVPFNNTGTPGAPVYTNSPFTPYKSSANSGFGSINFNADYTKLVLMAGYHCTVSCNWYNGLLRLSTFDTDTGVAGTVQNQTTFAWDNYHLNTGSGYSADFSPAGDYIYTTTLYEGWIYRYRIAGATTGAQIESSFDWGTRSAQADTMSNAGAGGGQVVRGPDGKMYVANWGANALSVVGNPDSSTPSGLGWAYNGQSLCVTAQPCDINNSASRYGLPQMVTIYTPQVVRY